MDERSPISNVNPWRAIWTRPREAVRAAIEQDRAKETFLLAILGGIVYGFDNVADRGFGDTIGLPAIVVIWLLAGAFGGLLGLYFNPGVLTWTGRWLGGRGSFRDVQFAYAWAQVPSLPAIVIAIGQIALYGRSLFTTEGPYLGESISDIVPLLLLILVALVLFVWTLVAFFRALSEVQGFSVWRAVASAAIPFLAIVALAVGVSLMVG